MTVLILFLMLIAALAAIGGYWIVALVALVTDLFIEETCCKYGDKKHRSPKCPHRKDHAGGHEHKHQ